MALATPIIACTYSEIALKGRNRKVFLRKLINNIHAALAGTSGATVRHVESRLLVHLADASEASTASARLRRVFGIQWLSPAVAVPRERIADELAAARQAGREPGLDAVCELAASLTAESRGAARTFKVHTRRSDRDFELDSPQINRIVGAAVQRATGLAAQMEDPDFVLNVLVLRENVLLFCAKEPACGGLPAGASGRVMVLLSGGIDSPVAAWLMMRRGSRPELIHFYSGRAAEDAECGKIERLAGILAGYSPVPLNLWLVPAVPYELRAIGAISDRYDMLMFRRFMVKTAAKLARRNSCQALVTGDSLGQVASQTLRNLGAISSDIELPILRPLIGLDKMEITAWAKRIGTFATSILPYRDCCSIRSPRPVLAARARDLLRYSTDMDLDVAVEEALAASCKLVIGPGPPRREKAQIEPRPTEL